MSVEVWQDAFDEAWWAATQQVAHDWMWGHPDLDGVRAVASRNSRWLSSSMLSGLGPVSPALWKQIKPIEAAWRQPWLRWYPPLVVDRARLGAQIDMLLDPTLALRTWVYDAFGLMVTPRQAEIIAMIEQGQVGLPPHWRSLPRH